MSYVFSSLSLESPRAIGFLQEAKRGLAARIRGWFTRHNRCEFMNREGLRAAAAYSTIIWILQTIEESRLPDT